MADARVHLHTGCRDDWLTTREPGVAKTMGSSISSDCEENTTYLTSRDGGVVQVPPISNEALRGGHLICLKSTRIITRTSIPLWSIRIQHRHETALQLYYDAVGIMTTLMIVGV